MTCTHVANARILAVVMFSLYMTQHNNILVLNFFNFNAHCIDKQDAFIIPCVLFETSIVSVHM